MGGNKYILNFTGINTVNGIKADGIQVTEGSHKDEFPKERKDVTCSKLFEFNIKHGGNSGRTVVNIDGTTVWEKGKMVSHSLDTTNDKYTDGYKDNAFTVTETGWVQQPDGSYKWMVTRVCKYCGYEETVEETKRDDITAVLLPALQANTDDHYSYLIGYADGTVRRTGRSPGRRSRRSSSGCWMTTRARSTGLPRIISPTFRLTSGTTTRSPRSLTWA